MRSRLRCLGQAELARYRALESLLPDPSLADPNPARSQNVPKDQAAFLKAYESREAEMIDFLNTNHLVTLPSYLGRFEIRQLPEAFKPTSPGGFMNPPGVYDKDDSGFYFIPTYNPQSKNFYIRAAIEDPRPILGHEGIPGHFLQLSIANHLPNEIRRQHGDGVFVEGWALYGEEMLMRTGLYPDNSACAGTGAAALALSRGAHRRRREPAYRPVDFRSGGELFHGSAADSIVKQRQAKRRARRRVPRKRSTTWSASGRSCGCSANIATSRAQTSAWASFTMT